MGNKLFHIYGKNSVIEYINSGKKPLSILIRNGINKDRKIKHILKICQDNSIHLEYTTEGELNRLTKNSNHQGVVLVTEKPKKMDLMNIEDLITELEHEKNSCVVLLDSIQDTHNMGAIIRSAEFFGISAVIIPEKNTAPINETVYKTSSGAIENIRIARVNNLKYAIELLKQSGFWIYGTYIDEGKSLNEVNFDNKTAIILGSESIGLKKTIKENCDFLIYIDRVGSIDSLNVSVSAGIVFYQYTKQNLITKFHPKL